MQLSRATFEVLIHKLDLPGPGTDGSCTRRSIENFATISYQLQRHGFFVKTRSVGDSSYTSFSSSSLVGTMSADTLIACPLACQALSSMYRSVTRSYTSLFSRKCQKGKIRLGQFFKKSKITLIFIYKRQKSEKVEIFDEFGGPSPVLS